jgi:hypothetical protein
MRMCERATEVKLGVEWSRERETAGWGVGVSLPKQIAEPAGRGRPRATKDVQPSFSIVVLRVDGGEADTTPRRRLLARYQRVWPEPSALLSSACQIWQK